MYIEMMPLYKSNQVFYAYYFKAEFEDTTVFQGFWYSLDEFVEWMVECDKENYNSAHFEIITEFMENRDELLH